MKKRLPVNPEYAEMPHICDMVTSFKHYNDITDLLVADVQLFVFYLSHWLVRGIVCLI